MWIGRGEIWNWYYFIKRKSKHLSIFLYIHTCMHACIYIYINIYMCECVWVCVWDIASGDFYDSGISNRQLFLFFPLNENNKKYLEKKKTKGKKILEILNGHCYFLHLWCEFLKYIHFKYLYEWINYYGRFTKNECDFFCLRG